MPFNIIFKTMTIKALQSGITLISHQSLNTTRLYRFKILDKIHVSQTHYSIYPYKAIIISKNSGLGYGTLDYTNVIN